MTRRALVPLLALLTLVAAGCQQSGPLIGGTPLPIKDAKVVSLSPSTTEVMSKSGNVNLLVGRTASCNWPTSLTRAAVVMTGAGPDYEKIAGIKPNIVVYDKALFSEAEIKKIDDLGIQTLGWNPNSLDEYADQSWQLANVIGGVMMTSEYIDMIYRNIEAARAGLEEKGLKDVRIALMVGRDSYLVAGKESLWADLVKRMSGEMVGPSGTAYAPMNIEALVQANPEVILSAGTGAQILADPRLRTVSAVVNKRVYDVDADVMLRRGGRLEMLAEAIGAGLNKVRRN